MRVAPKDQELAEVLKYYVTHHQYLPRAVKTEQLIAECNTEKPY